MKKKTKDLRLVQALTAKQLWIYIGAVIGLLSMVAFMIVYWFYRTNIYFYLLVGFSIATEAFVLLKVAMIPSSTAAAINNSITDDMMRTMNSLISSKDNVTMSHSGIIEFDDLKKRFVDIINSMRDVVIVDREIDDSYLKFGYEYGYDNLITRDSFIYNLPFILKLNSYSRGGLFVAKIVGEETPIKAAIEGLIKEIRKTFSSKVYIGMYSSDTLVCYVSDIESLSIYRSLLLRLYYSYSMLKSELSKSVVYSVTIGGAVYPYSSKESLLPDALEALNKSTNVVVFIPSDISYREKGVETLDDVRRKDLIIIERMISFLYHGGNYEINSEELNKNILPLARASGFETVGIICRSSLASEADSMSCIEEVGNPAVRLFGGRNDISFDEVRSLYEAKDEDDVFFSTRREDLPPAIATIYDRHSLKGMYCSFFGEENQVMGMSYLLSSQNQNPLSSVDSHVMVLVMMVLNYIALAKLSDYRYKLLGSDLETILKMSDKHRYLVNEKTFALEGMSDGLIYQYGKGALGKKCHKVFFNSDFVCKDCPLLSGQSGDTPVVYMKEKFLRKRLSYQTPDNIASLLLEPYNPNDELRKSVIRFDPVTCLSSRASFNETVTNLVIGKAKGTLLLIILEGVNEIITNYGETNLNNILIEMRKRIMDSDNAERIYRYDDSVLAIYFDGVTRIQLYDLMENIHALIKTPYAIEGRMIKCNYRYSEINFNGTFATSGEVFALIDKGLMTARKGMDNNLTIPNETITRVASKSDYIISLMEENFLNKAVEFRIQPIVKIKDGSIKYGEILLRLYDVLREKMLSPLEVVTIASDAKKMGKFDSLNYETAIGLYNKYGAGVFHIYAYSGFSINLSSDSLESNEWLSRLKRFIEANPCPEGYLGVEIPERSFSDNQGRIKIWFNELRGYHLNWLVDNYDDSVITPREASELGFKTLKLSRKFLMDALADPIAKGLFESVVREAHYNGLTVVAQGVESKEQFDFCKTAGADYIQGFYLYSPLKIEEFLTALQEKPDKKKLGLESAAGIPEKVIPAQEQIKTKKTFKERREEKKNAKLLKKADKAKEKAAEEIEAQ